jgi:hypothetical protein
VADVKKRMEVLRQEEIQRKALEVERARQGNIAPARFQETAGGRGPRARATAPPPQAPAHPVPHPVPHAAIAPLSAAVPPRLPPATRLLPTPCLCSCKLGNVLEPYF